MKPVDDSIKSRKILIVDDSRSMRSMLAAILREFGIKRIEEAGDGEDALRKLQASGYDLVLCDWEMPVMSGIELLEKARSDDTTAEIPFIMVTSLANEKKVRQAIAVGTTDYIVKPLNTETVISKIVRALSA